MHTSENGIRLIKSFEGFVGHPYRDAVGVWTIGYGHTEGVGPHTKHITEHQGEQLLRRDLARKYEPFVNPFVGNIKHNQNRYDALVSFVYNLGGGILGSSHTIGAALRRGNMHDVAAAFLLYDKAGGRTLPGLLRRRLAERKLFKSPVAPPWVHRDIRRKREILHEARSRRRHHKHPAWTPKAIIQYNRLKARIARWKRRHTHVPV